MNSFISIFHGVWTQLQIIFFKEPLLVAASVKKFQIVILLNVSQWILSRKKEQ